MYRDSDLQNIFQVPVTYCQLDVDVKQMSKECKKLIGWKCNAPSPSFLKTVSSWRVFQTWLVITQETGGVN